MVRQPTITLAMWQSEVIAPAMQAGKRPDEELGVDFGDRVVQRASIKYVVFGVLLLPQGIGRL